MPVEIIQRTLWPSSATRYRRSLSAASLFVTVCLVQARKHRANVDGPPQRLYCESFVRGAFFVVLAGVVFFGGRPEFGNATNDST